MKSLRISPWLKSSKKLYLRIMEPATVTAMEIILFSDTDSVTELTSLLNLAYKKWEEKGFKYLASHQGDGVTQERISQGKCYIIRNNSGIIATITYYPPGSKTGHPLYMQKGTSTYGQLAVRPDLQRQGLASRLINFVEKLALSDGANRMIIDTAEDNHELIKYYIQKKYVIVGHTSWPTTNYRSVFMEKKLH